jgi:hypothetical protein
VEATERIAEQLQMISEVVETITYRLLELEERLADQDRRLEVLVQQEPRGGDASAEAQHRLDDTEERLGRLESLLSDVGAPLACTRLSVVGRAASALEAGPSGMQGEAGEQDIDGPFPEEPEQPFLDDHDVDQDAAQGRGELPSSFLTA